MNVREAIETIGMQRLADLAGCTRTTIDRTKQRGDVSSSPTGARIRQAIRDEGLRLDGDGVGGEQPDLPMEDALSTRLRKEDLAAKSERARGLKMKNDEAEGLLLPVDEVRARLGTAATFLRTGVDGARRSVEIVCCDGCRGAVVAEFDGAMAATIAAVLGALEGE